MTTFTSDGPYISVTFDGVNAQICFSASDARTFARKLSTAADELEPAPAAQPTLTQALEALREPLSDLSHEIWSSWTRWQFSVCTAKEDGSLTIPASLVERWTRQMNTPYAELSEREKDSDREQAAKIIAVLQAASAEPDAAGSEG